MELKDLDYPSHQLYAESIYVEHLHKVMPKVIEVNGNPSGY